MYFIFSKILLFLINPFFWILTLFIIALFYKKPVIKRRLYICAAVIFIVFSNPFLLRTFIKLWDYPRTTLKKTDKYSCVILLGGFTSEDENRNGYFNSASDRFIQAVKLATTGQVSHILVSSGNASLFPDNFREGDWVKTQISQFNVPDSSILVEDSSRNTLENALYSKKTLLAKHLKPPYLLVTGTYHMRRAMYIFKKYNIPVIPYAAEYGGGSTAFSISQLMPEPGVLATWPYYIKEVVGLVVAHFK